MNSGRKLAEEAESLFVWYGHWMGEYPKNFQYLSLLIFLSKISSNGGNFLTEAQEVQAIEKLGKLKEDLDSGKIRHGGLAAGIHFIIEDITEHSAKAKLVVQSKKLERALYSHLEHEEGFLERSKLIFTAVLDQITPQLPDIHALAVAKEFAQILSKIKSGILNPKELLHHMEIAMRSWLPEAGFL